MCVLELLRTIAEGHREVFPMALCREVPTGKCSLLPSAIVLSSSRTHPELVTTFMLMGILGLCTDCNIIDSHIINYWNRYIL